MNRGCRSRHPIDAYCYDTIDSPVLCSQEGNALREVGHKVADANDEIPEQDLEREETQQPGAKRHHGLRGRP